MSVRTGVLIDSFDPVYTKQIRFCVDTLKRLRLDRIFLVPLTSVTGSACSVSLADRYRMLVAACAGRKELCPVLLPNAGLIVPDRKGILEQIRNLYPNDRLIPLTDSSSTVSEMNDSGAFLSGSPEPPEICPSVLEYCSVLGLYGSESRMAGAAYRMNMLFDALKPRRFAHSLAVAFTARRLALRYKIDPDKAEEAGLFHDCAKCLPLSEMQKLASAHNLTDDPDIFNSGALLHSVVGAYLAREKYSVRDQDILDAIAYHNTGCPGMSRLAMCICLADYIEPNREPFPSLEETRRLAGISLERALLFSLESTAQHVLSSGNRLHSRTLDTISWLKTFIMEEKPVT